MGRTNGIILAGGRGTRLLPLTSYLPKHLFPINGEPIIIHVIRQCLRGGVEHLWISVPDQSVRNLIEKTLAEHIYLDSAGDEVSIKSFAKYRRVVEGDGTAGNILRIAKDFDEGEFVVYCGDILTNFRLDEMIRLNLESDACCTLAVAKKKELEFGVLRTSSSGDQVTEFYEHPSLGDITPYMVNVGIAVLKTRALHFLKTGDDFFGASIPKIIMKRNRMYLVNTFEIENFVDIGTFRDLERAARS